MGRVDRWTRLEMDRKLILVEGWARDGLTEKQIAQNLGVSHTTFDKWKKEKPAFLEALKENKDTADRHVENALYKSALGFHYEEQAVTNKGEVVTVQKYEKPSTTAQIFWLKNRKRVEWRDKQEIQHEGKIDSKITYVAEWGDDGNS